MSFRRGPHEKILGVVGTIALVAMLAPRSASSQISDRDLDTGIVQIEGEAECLLEEDELQPADAPCNQPGSPYAFRTHDDRLFYLIDGDPKSEVFIDPRIRRQPILLEGWIRAERQFEILMVYTIIDGRPHHVHYRCDVCDIDATAPGPCWCCGQEFELRQPEASRQARKKG